jgi:hypothetical protein
MIWVEGSFGIESTVFLVFLWQVFRQPAVQCQSVAFVFQIANGGLGKLNGCRSVKGTKNSNVHSKSLGSKITKLYWACLLIVEI